MRCRAAGYGPYPVKREREKPYQNLHELLTAALGEVFRAVIGPSSPVSSGEGRAKRNVAVHCEKAPHGISSSSIFGWIWVAPFSRGRNLSDQGLITSKIADPGSLPSLPGSKGIKDKIAYV
jgi:hypothetical protein